MRSLLLFISSSHSDPLISRKLWALVCNVLSDPKPYLIPFCKQLRSTLCTSSDRYPHPKIPSDVRSQDKATRFLDSSEWQGENVSALLGSDWQPTGLDRCYLSDGSCRFWGSSHLCVPDVLLTSPSHWGQAHWALVRSTDSFCGH